jgi:PAT family beta-lactamase induction signal transducer AmpG
LLIVLPRNATVFGLAMLGENGFQASAFTVSNIITLRTIGHDNPLAATQWSLLIAASVLPLVYMQVIDGAAYFFGGAAGSFLADALISATACALLGLVLWAWRSRVPAI